MKNWAPCPFARKARINEKLKIHPVFENVDISFLEKQAQKFLSDDKQVYIFVYPNIASQNEDEVVASLLSLREGLVAKDIYLLFDHPNRKELMNGVDFSHGKYGLVLLQRLSDLNQATEELKASDYYETWDDDYYNRVVGKRESLIKNTNQKD